MNFQQISGHGDCREDQSPHDYIRDEGGFAIFARGHYTVAELEHLLACLKEANEYWQPARPRVALPPHHYDLER
jgi:hypothetical protein